MNADERDRQRRAAHELPAGTTVTQAVATLTGAHPAWPSPSTRRSSRGARGTRTALGDGDRVEVLTAVQGG